MPTGDHTRMDAVWIVHGLPVTLLERVDEFRAQYDNRLDFPVQQEFHLDPRSTELPDIGLEDEFDLDTDLDAAVIPNPDRLGD